MSTKASHLPQYCTGSHPRGPWGGCVSPQKISILMAIFGPTWTWKDTWMGHKSVPSIYSHCLGCVLAHYPVSRLIFSLNMASCHFGCFLPPKPPIFGPTWTWNDTWMGHKSAQNIYPHCLECVLAHYPVSRLFFLFNMVSCHFGYF